MITELITIIVSLLVLVLIYFSRIKSEGSKTFLFSEKFLHKADEKIFDFVKFVFKLYSLLFGNISIFISKTPHMIMNMIHKISHAVAQKSSEWIEKVTHKNNK